jgi:protein-L-isoaspartate(D-aspartate) O-methyltransferase
MLGQDGERTGHIDSDGHVCLHWDADQPIDPATLTGVLDRPKAAVWSKATVGVGESFDGVWLRLTGAEPGTYRIAAEPAAIDARLRTPAIPSRSPALVDGASLAYFTLRRLDQDAIERRWELGAIGHGPTGPQLADRLCEQIRAWDRDRTAQPLITAYPAGTQARSCPTGWSSTSGKSGWWSPADQRHRANVRGPADACYQCQVSPRLPDTIQRTTRA